MKNKINSAKKDGTSGTKTSFISRKKNGKSIFFQPQLTVGPVDDQYEREADAVAEKVIQSGTGQVASSVTPVEVQRKCSKCEEEEKVQRTANDKDDQERTAPDIVEEAINTPGVSLDESSKTFMENKLGYDFSNVKIHTGTLAAKSAESVNAVAYTSGNNIVFNEGQYAPNTVKGKKLLAHELAHVIQQGGSSAKVQRDTMEEETTTENGLTEETTEDVTSVEAQETDSKQGTACCSSDERTMPQMGYDFNINEYVVLPEMCTNTNCVNVRIRSHWASTHAARHFRVRMAVFGTGGSATEIVRRYDVGSETQRFNVGRCKSFMITIEVFSPTTSPNLVGIVDVTAGGSTCR